MSPQLIHATFKSNWPIIERCGIKPKVYSYFTTILPNAGELVPGMSKECDTFIYLKDDALTKYTFESYEHGYRTKDIIHPSYFKTVLFTPPPLLIS